MAIIDRQGGSGISTTDEGGKTRWQGRGIESDEGTGSRQKGRELDWSFFGRLGSLQGKKVL